MMEIERPKIETASLSPDGRYGRFVAEPLERGFGITLGNSLRRDRKSTRLNSSHSGESRMPSSA